MAEGANLSSLYQSIADNFAGSSYEQLAKSNPYFNHYNKETSWDKFVHSLGFRSSYDKAESERMLNAAVTDFNLQTSKREEEYNSEASQVERQSAVGINSDLNGITPSQASEMTEDPDPAAVADDQSGKPFEIASTVASIASNVFTGALNLMGQVQDIEGRFYDLQGKRINNANELSSIAYDTLLSMPYESIFDHIDSDAHPGVINALYIPDNLWKSQGFSRSARKKLAAYYSQYAQDFRTSAEWYGVKNMNAKARQEWYQRFKDSRHYSDDNSIMKHMSDFATQVFDQIFDDNLNIEASSTAVESEYQGTLINENYGIDSAEADIAAARKSKQSNKMESDLNSSIAKWISGLRKDADNGDKGAKFLLAACAMLPQVLQILQGAASTGTNMYNARTSRINAEKPAPSYYHK